MTVIARARDRGYRLLAWLLLAPSMALGQTVVDGDAWVTGKAGVGTTAPSARLEVQASSVTETVFQVSGVDETPFLVVTKTGEVGLSTVSSANLDINGVGDVGDVGLQIRNGGLYPSSDGIQMTFGYAGQASYRHAIRTRHSSTTANNSMDFLLWTPGAGAASTLPSLEVLSLVSTATGASFHVLSAGTPDVEVEVSNASSVGGGTILCASESTHSSRALKKDITHIGREGRQSALQDVAALRHARFRYKKKSRRGLVRDRKAPLRRGLIYEDAPASVQGPGQSIVLDERVANAELALQEIIQRLEGLRAQAAALEEPR